MPSDQLHSIVEANLNKVRDRIANACAAASRDPDTVQLIGVSKYVGPTETAALVAAGCDVLGEARPQQLWSKTEAAELAQAEIQWRLIGHLQRNKAERTVAVASSIDSVDSQRLLTAIDRAASNQAEPQPVLLEVNVSGDAEKHGFSPAELPNVIGELDRWPNVEVRGLMAMASREGGQETARLNFAQLRGLSDKLSTAELPLQELSMGMSGDLEAAIAEGSTLVRVGTALWEGVDRI